MAAPAHVVEETGKRVWDALSVMYITQPGQPADTNKFAEANKFLQSFQSTPEAWQIAHKLLDAQNAQPAFHIFAGQTLRSKIQQSFGELDTQLHAQFRDSLLQHLLKHGGQKQVITQLALCVADVAIQMQSWHDPVQSLVQSLNKPETMSQLLMVLTELPEECQNRNVLISKERYHTVCETLGKHTNLVINQVLPHLMGQANNDPKTQKLVFECLGAWVRFGCWQDEEIAQCVLLPAAFDALQSEELFQSAVSVLIDVIHDSCVGKPTHTVCLPRVLALGQLLQQTAKDKDDIDETGRRVAQVICEAGESWQPWIITNVHENAQAQQLFSLLLQVAGHPNRKVTEQSFRYWQLLCDSFEGPLMRNPEQRLQVKTAVSPHLLRLMECLSRVMQFPDDFDEDSADEQDDFKKFRYTCADILVDMSHIIGAHQTLAHIVQMIATQFDHFQKLGPQDKAKRWQGLEATFYCVRSVARAVPVHETEFLPKIFQLIPQLPDNPSIRYTTTLIVGRYANWINRNASLYLQPLLGFVISGLNIPKVQGSAALAFKYLCSECYDHLLENQAMMETLFSVYGASRQLDLVDQKELIEGLTTVVSEAKVAERRDFGLNQLVNPPATEIINCMAQPSPSTEVLASALDRMSHMFKALHVNVDEKQTHPVVAIIQQLWPTIEKIFATFNRDDRMMEKTTRLMKYAIRCAPDHFQVLVSQLLNVCAKLYHEHPLSCYIYTSSICVGSYGSDPQFAEVLNTILRVFSDKTFTILKDAKGFQDNPDIAEDFFELFIRYLDCCPDILFKSPYLPQIFQCGYNGLSIQHKDAFKSVTAFYRRLAEQGIPSSKFQPKAENVQILQALLQQHGQQFMTLLVKAMVHDLAYIRLKDVDDIFWQLGQLSKEMTQSFMAQALQQAPETTHPTKQKFLVDFVAALGHSQRVLHQTIKEFYEACKRVLGVKLSSKWDAYEDDDNF